ncbi:MAG: hypothetical protein R2854_18315 [Caldilineaceae bacterium]
MSSMKNFARSLKPEPKNLRSDLVSGFATGLFSIPEGTRQAVGWRQPALRHVLRHRRHHCQKPLTTGTILMISTLTSAIALSTASVLQTANIQDSQMPAASSPSPFWWAS